MKKLSLLCFALSIYTIGIGQNSVGLQVDENFTVLFGQDTTSEVGAKLIWFPSKAAFRVGAPSEFGSTVVANNDRTRWNKFNTGELSFASGFSTMAYGHASTAMGNFTDAWGPSCTAMGYGTSAAGEHATAMGSLTQAQAHYSTAMGRETMATGQSSTAMGYRSTASGLRSVAMGRETVSSAQASIAMGSTTTASANAAIAMGYLTTASGGAAIAMGWSTTASGNTSTAMGYETTASGDFSTAMGRRVNTNNKEGGFMIGDSDPLDEGVTLSSINDRMICRFYNGYLFLTSGDGASGSPRTGFQAAHGANFWTSISDRNAKEKLVLLDDQEVLEKLSSIDYHSWNYKGQDPKTFRHYGIMAQDFYKLFGKDKYGTIGCDSLVNPIDMLGITMSAIKGSAEKIEAQEQLSDLQEAKIAKQEKQIHAQQEKIVELAAKVAQLTDLVKQLAVNQTLEEENHVILKDKARVEQNQPNPFNEETLIRYYIPEGSMKPEIRITNLEGKIIKSIPIQATGEGQLTLQAQSLSAGTYLYSLIVDGNLIATEKMIWTGKN